MLQGREKEKKLKPIKQPVKPTRVMVASNKQPTDSHAPKESIQRSKLPGSMTSSVPSSEPKINTLDNVCMGLLESGCVQAYIDLFYVSHKCLPNVMQKKNYFGEPLHIPE